MNPGGGGEAVARRRTEAWRRNSPPGKKLHSVIGKGGNPGGAAQLGAEQGGGPDGSDSWVVGDLRTPARAAVARRNLAVEGWEEGLPVRISG